MGYLIEADFNVFRLRRQCLLILRDYLADEARNALALAYLSELRSCLSERDLDAIDSQGLIQTAEIATTITADRRKPSPSSLSYLHLAMEQQLRNWSGDLSNLTAEAMSDEPASRLKFALAYCTAADLSKQELLEYFANLTDAPLHLQRIAAFKIGQYPYPELIDLLIPLLSSTSDEIRIEAATAIIKLLSGKKARKKFVRAYS